jgi:DNA-binding NarL/FixJ family response regulator
VVGEAGDGAEAVALTRQPEPDVVLMDVRMPRMDGVEATRALVDGGSRSHIIILTTFDLDEYAHAALRAGASGFLLKGAPTADLLSAIRAVASVGEAARDGDQHLALMGGPARAVPPGAFQCSARSGNGK